VILPWGEPSGYVRKVILPTLARTFKFDLNAPWKNLPAAARKVLLDGAPGRTLTYQYESERFQGSYQSSWEGVLKHVERRYRETASDGVRDQLEESWWSSRAPPAAASGCAPKASPSWSMVGASETSWSCPSPTRWRSSRASRCGATAAPGSTPTSRGRSSRR